MTSSLPCRPTRAHPRVDGLLLGMLLALLAGLFSQAARAEASSQDAGWRAWKAGLFEQVYATPRAVADAALQRLATREAPQDVRGRLQATIALTMAAQALSREAQHQARDWLEAGVIEARASGAAHRDLAVDLIALHALDDAMLGRYATAERLLTEASGLMAQLQDPAQAWGVFFARGALSMARGDGAGAVAHFDQALQRTSSDLQRAVTLIWKAMAFRRYANPVSGMLRTSLQLLEEARQLASGARYPVFGMLELYTQIQGEVTLGDFTRAGAHAQEAAQVLERLAPQGYEHPETASGVMVAQFRREDVVLAERLQRQRLLLVWGLGVTGMLVCATGTILLLRLRQRRRLRGLSSQLEARNRELQELASSRARLLAAACHDLRQPAHALGLSAELAMLARARGPATENDAEVRRRLQSIRRNSVTLTDMLGELMDQSRLTGGTYEADIGPVALQELLYDVQLQFGDVARRKGLVLKVDDCPATVMSDRHLLQRICFNLVSNAVKYTRQGTVHVAAETLPQGQVRLAVQDTGPGIPPEHLGTVFQDYVRVHTDGAQEGLGIGLSVVKRGADLLGHKLTLESEVGRGTLVTLTLPLATSAAESLRPADLAAPAGEGARPGREQLIGMLEDDAESRRAVASQLRRWGYRVIEGESADDMAAQLGPEGPARLDLLLTDLHLGPLDGLEQATRIRHWPGHERLPVILITGDLDASVTGRAADLGIAVGHKPITPRRLLGLIQAALEASDTVPASPR